MALMKWGDDEEKDDNLFQAPTIKTISSVQDSWQPTQQNGNGGATADGQVPQGNYLLSEEKAQVDQQKRMKEAAEAARQAQIAEQSAIARRQQAAEDAATQQLQETQPPAGGKYTPVKEKKDEGLWGFVKDVGAGIQQGLGAVGDIAIQGGSLLGDISNPFISKERNDAARIKNMESTDVLRNWLHGQKDFNGSEIVGTRDVEDSATRINNGTATLQDYAAISGKGLQAGIDSTMFLNPARLATKGIPGAALVDDGANLATRVFKSPAVQYAARDATFFGGLQGTATFQSVYGQTGDFEQAMEAAIQDAVIGAGVQGTLDIGGNAINVAANRTLNSLRRPGELTPVKELIDAAENGGNVVEGALDAPQNLPENVTPVTEGSAPTDGNVSFQPIENSDLGQPTNLLDEASADPNYTPVADGVVAPVIDTPGEPVVPSTIQDAPVVPEILVTDTTVAPVADGVSVPSKVMPETTGNMPVIKSEEVRKLQEAKAGANQADEAAINQELNAIDTATPRANNLPDDMNMDITGANVDGSPLTSEQIVQPTLKDLADRTVTGAAKPDDLKARLARAVGLPEDATSPINELLDGAKLNEGQKQKLTSKFDELQQVLDNQNQIQRDNRKLLSSDNLAGVSPEQTKEWSSLERRKGELQRDISNTIRLVDSRKSVMHRAAYMLENVVSAKNANQLASAPGVERNLVQDTLGTVEAAIKNPIRTLKSIPNGGNPIKSAVKSAVGGWKDTPKSLSDTYKYGIGNVYNTAMIPTTAVANMRSQPIREAIAEMGLRSTGKKPTRKEVINYARTLDGDAEALTNVLGGVANAMTNRHQANKAIKAYQELVQTGSPASRKALQDLAERQTTLAQKLVKGFEKEGTPIQRIGSALAEAVLPYVRVATNASINAAYRLVPNRTVIDEVLSSVRSNPENFASIIKNKAFDYGLIGTVMGMVGAGVITYNNGDDVDKPRGISIKVGDNQYVPIRATNVETEIAAITTAMNLASGKSNAGEALNTLADSLPYISSTENIVKSGQSLLNGDSEDGDGMYAAKSYGIGQAKSLVPFSNNGIQPYVAGKNGQSLNAKTTYDKDPSKWFAQAVQSSYDPNFRNSLKDSRDAAGRVRTVDNQGAVINKTINDADTKTHNDDVTRLVKYGRENDFGKGVQDMFNSYDTGKNNNFKGIQDSITFLDVTEGADGKKTPKNEDKLKKNPKLTNLSQQIRDGFYGESGDELLQLDGQNLYSDVSAPNSSGSKNSRMPISMQSIKNAIAQTDLPEAERNRIYEISQGDTALYNRLKAKEITYDQYSAEKAKTGQEYIDILSGSDSYKKMTGLFDELDNNGFFEDGGMGSTRSGQTYLWNSLNALLGSKGATPAANYPDTSKFTPYGSGGGGTPASYKPGDRGEQGVKFTPVTARQQAETKRAKFTPLSIKVKLGNEVKKNKTQNYADKTF